jgi:type IV secretory pathway VirB10-like protein
VEDRDPNAPEVAERSPQAQGPFSEKKRHIILSVGVIIILLIGIGYSAFQSNATLKQAKATPYQPPIKAAPIDSINLAGNDVKEAERRAKEAEEKMNAAAQAYKQATGQPAPPQPVMGPNGIMYTPAPVPAQPEPVDPIQAKRIEREYNARFASSVALNFTAIAAKAAEPVKETPAAPPPAAASTSPAQEPKPASPAAPTYSLYEGTVIEAVLINRLEGSFAGPVLAQITTDIYSNDGQVLLIKKGSKVIGEARKVGDRDQQRLAVAFHRLIMKGGYSVNLDQLPGLDQAGATALKDKVNHHYLATFGTSIMLGALAGLSMAGTQGGYVQDGSDAYRQGVSRQISSDATRILDRQLNRLPEITIREGHRIKLILSADLSLPAYQQHPAPGL